MKVEQSTLTIYYPRRRGCILEAHKLQQKIRANFDLFVAIEEHKKQSFALVLDGAAIFSENISDCAAIDHVAILGVIGGHEKPLAKIGDSASEDSDRTFGDKFK